jgi:hypothetical protein
MKAASSKQQTCVSCPAFSVIWFTMPPSGAAAIMHEQEIRKPPHTLFSLNLFYIFRIIRKGSNVTKHTQRLPTWPA